MKKTKNWLALLLAFALCMALLPTVALAADTIDLTGAVTGGRVTVNSTTITISGTDDIILTGDSGGKAVVVEDATNITLAAGTNINASAGRGDALTVPGGTTIHGAGAGITITGIDRYIIYASGDLSITGTLGNLSGGRGIFAGLLTISGIIGNITANGGSAIRAGDGVIISGTVGDLVAGQNCINTVDLTISGTVGNLVSNSSTCIYTWGDVTITGTVGDITANGIGIFAVSGGSVTISGTVGDITANMEGIYADSGNVTISGTVGDITAELYGILAGGSININSPVLVSGAGGAFSKQPVIGLASYTAQWSLNASGAPVAGSSADSYTWAATHKWVKIIELPKITTASLPNGTVGTAYSKTLAATSPTPITWSLDSGSLPPGLALAPATGVISGTPTTAGTFSFTVKAETDTDSDTKALSIVINSAPSITGPTTMTLTTGYAAASTGTYTVTGTAPVTVTKTSGNAAITWNGGTMKLDIAAGLTAGSYPVVLTASNGIAPDATITFTLTVSAAPVTPGITGPTSMTLTAGYMAASTGTYTITGTAPVTVTKTSGNAAITWNGGTMKLDIAAGLTAGSYPVVLTASNGIAPDATITFTLTVQSGGGNSGNSGYGYSANYASITPTKATFDKNPDSKDNKDISITFSSGNYKLNDLKNGEYKLVKDKDYTVSGNKYTIKAAYLATLDAGSHTLTFDMNGGTDPKLTITVTDTTPSKPVNPFKDVKESDWFYDAAMYLYKRGIMIGMGNDEFGGNTNLSRAMMVQILYNLAGKPDVSGFPNPFSDVEDGAWYANAIKWAASNGITVGYGDGKFGTNDPVTNEQLAMFIRNLQLSSGKIPPDVLMDYEHPDWNKISDWAKGAVNLLTTQGAFMDIPGTNFNPQDPATRAAVASVLYRYLTAVE